METIDLTELFAAQKLLDATIAANHHVTYATTHARRTLALLVEIGEFANTTRCFKYWSNKGMEEKETVLDEYADGLHFFLSLGIDIGTKQNVYNIVKPDINPSEMFLKVYREISDFYQDSSDENYIKAFSSFLNILPLFSFTAEDLKEAYFKKLGTNYVRQQTNY